jgi:amino acid transporter
MMHVNVRKLVLGRRLANREFSEQKIGAFEGVAVMGLDGLGSSAYGPEAALTILIPLGAASLSYIGWVMAPIVALLAILFASYWQTIRAYPSNGGAYVVAKENLGRNASLLAAAALMIDYVLNVSVGISAGVGALVSAVPELHPYILWLCLGFLAIITLMNLRGTQESGRVLAIPTYLFLTSFAIILGLGTYKAFASAGHPQPVVAPPGLPQATEAVSIWLLLRAFASGCTAMTGVEAVSNGMSAFREPPVTYGHRTLTAIVVSLGLLLIAIAHLSTAYGIGAMDQTQEGYQSVLSQLCGAVAGRGTLYYVAIGSLLCVLALSANTSFVGFPRLCRTVAEDGFLPKSFAIAGRRLVFSVGILYLAACSGSLLLIFDGITDHLIPLFAIGAFLTFTLSQTGMAFRWRRMIRAKEAAGKRATHRTHFWINAVGATTTAIALIIIIIAKFAEGAWITILAIPCAIALLKGIRHYYDELEAQVREGRPLDLSGGTEPPIVLVSIEGWSKLAAKAIGLGLTLSPDVIGLHLTQLQGPDCEEDQRAMRMQWEKNVAEPARKAGLAAPRLMALNAQYRAMHEPVLRVVQELKAKFPGRRVAVLIPELVKQRWYQRILHTHRARRLRTQLLTYGGAGLTVISVPWYLDAVPHPAEAE